MIDLNKLKELAAKASPGPWHIGHVNEEHGWADIVSIRSEIIADDVDRHNQSYLCSVDPQSLLKLIEVIEVYELALNLYSKSGLRDCAISALQLRKEILGVNK